MRVLFLIQMCTSIVTATVQNRNTEVDLVLDGLNDQRWEEEDEICVKRTIFVLENVKNYTVWAMWIWNSIQHPFGTFQGSQHSLGSYDQCLQAPTSSTGTGISTQYCLVDIKLTEKKFNGHNVLGDTEAYLGTRTKIKRDLSKVTWGVCLPDICKPVSVVKILKTIYMVNPITPAEPTILVDYCEKSGTKREFTTGFYVFLTLVAVWVSVVLFATFYIQKLTPESTISPIATSFCVLRNWTNLTKETTDDIPILNLVKVVLAWGVIVTHSFYFRVAGPLSNALDFDRILMPIESDYIIFKMIRNIDMLIDIFFVMSGLLLIKGFTAKKRNPIVSLVNRYFRFMGIFSFVIFFSASVIIHTGDGPLWQKLAGTEQSAATASWMWGVFMINNFVGSDQITHIVAWYIPCDFQLAVMGTILFTLWQKNRYFGKLAAIVVCALSLVIPGVVTYWKKLPGMLVFDDIEQIVDFRKNVVFLETYIKFYHRMVPYLLGMALGIIMTVFKPAKHRRLFSMKWSLFLFMGSIMVLVRVCTDTTFWCLTPSFNAAVGVSLKRLFFGLPICVLIATVEYGRFDFFSKIASYNVFTVMSRLTYGSYLTHSLFLQQNAFSRRSSQDFSLVNEVIFGLGMSCLIFTASVILWLFVEAPLNNVVMIFTDSVNSQVQAKEIDDEQKTSKAIMDKINDKLQENTFDKMQTFTKSVKCNFDKIKIM